MSKVMISISVEQKEADYYQQIRKERKKEGKMVSAVFKEFVDAHKEKYESELK